VLIDGRSIPSGSELECDLCIVGAGAAGIALALALANTSLSVVLLESGGFDVEADTQDLARGAISGLPYYPLESARLRCFGGSTQHWGGWCRPFEPIDFATRSWVPDSGWPIELATLDAHYRRAQDLCQLGTYDYAPGGWQLDDAPPLGLPAARVATHLIQFSPPARFGELYRDQVVNAPNIRTCLHANVVDIEASANLREIHRLAVRTLTGNRFSVLPKVVVLAAGGIDNARLLLASNRQSAAGIGNANDIVGRYFADHIQLDTASVVPLDTQCSFDLYQSASRSRTRASRHADGKPASLMGYLTLDPTVQRERRTLNFSANLFEATWSDYVLNQKPTERTTDSWFASTANSLQRFWRHVGNATSKRLHAAGEKVYKIVTTQEQAPNPNSRVTLAAEKDPLGMPRAQLHWQLNDLDKHTIMTSMAELASAFGAAGIARLHTPDDVLAGDWESRLRGSWHHCGTTRMHADPKHGVVDADCRVHGLANLYVAGSSVFPTSGNGNPTLTVVALALRLADHLKTRMHQHGQ
jgi:choline dehydrogenase-like flavoprotein